MKEWRERSRRMVETQLVPRGIAEERLLQAFMEVPRHLFVQSADEVSAYEDYPLPIGHGQTISQPYMVARMTDLLDVHPGCKVLEIGTGSGYQAAVLAQMGARVFSIERIPALARQAQKNLSKAGYNVIVSVSDGRAGLPEFAPYGRVLVTAAAGEVHHEWEEQLDTNGMILAPVKVSYGTERLLLRRRSKTGWKDTWHDYCRFVPLLSGLEKEDDDGTIQAEDFHGDGE